MKLLWTAVMAGALECCLLPRPSFSQQHTGEASSTAIVAVAGGKPITLTKSSREAVENYFYARNRRAPDAVADREGLVQAELAWQCAQLNQKVSTIAEDLAKARFAVTVSEEEMRSVAQARLGQVDPEAEAGRMRAANAPIAAALEEVYDRGTNPEEVYQSTVRQLGLTEEAWRIHVYLGREPAYRARLRQAASVTGTALAASIRDTRAAVENRKLHAAVDREIGLKNPAFLADLRLLEEGGAPFAGPAVGDAYARVGRARAAWWAGFYASLKVKILEAGLKSSCTIQPPRWQ